MQTTTKLTKKELARLEELMRKGNDNPNLPADELIKTLTLLKKAGVTPFMLLGSLMKTSTDPSMRLLGSMLLK